MKFLAPLLLCAAAAFADAPEVIDASARQMGNTWAITVTLSHADTGWQHYANGWHVLAPDGSELGFRLLLHPHVTEQPFTRVLTGVHLAEGIDSILIRPRCLVDGLSAKGFVLDLQR